jgi:hypothetical protein
LCGIFILFLLSLYLEQSSFRPPISRSGV